MCEVRQAVSCLVSDLPLLLRTGRARPEEAGEPLGTGHGFPAAAQPAHILWRMRLLFVHCAAGDPDHPVLGAAGREGGARPGGKRGGGAAFAVPECGVRPGGGDGDGDGFRGL